MVMEKGNIIFGVIMSVMATSRLVETYSMFNTSIVTTEHEKNTTPMIETRDKIISLVFSKPGGGGIIEENVTVSGNEIDISLINSTHIVFDREKREWVVRTEERENCSCYLADLSHYLPRFMPGFFEAQIASGSNSKKFDNPMYVHMTNFHSGKDALLQRYDLSERAEKMCEDINLYSMSEDYIGNDRKSDICFRTCWMVCEEYDCYVECVYVCP